MQENIFGDDQVFTDMNEKPEMPAGHKAMGGAGAGDNQTTTGSDDDTASHKDFDPREYRPLEVVVSITMHDIQAHLVKVTADYRLCRLGSAKDLQCPRRREGGCIK